jgi:hypothetical protein
MTPEFLRHEAARFRGMAEDADREATKARLLSMAMDYEARAGVAIEMIHPDPTEENPEPTEENAEPVEPVQDAAPIIKPVRKLAMGLKETVVVQRRPVGRPRRE